MSTPPRSNPLLANTPARDTAALLTQFHRALGEQRWDCADSIWAASGYLLLTEHTDDVVTALDSVTDDVLSAHPVLGTAYAYSHSGAPGLDSSGYTALTSQLIHYGTTAGDAWRTAQDPNVAALLVTYQIHGARRSGKTAKGQKLYDDALSHFRETGRGLPGVICLEGLHLSRGLLEFESGRLQSALDYLGQIDGRTVRRGANPEIAVLAHGVAALIHALFSHGEHAAAHLAVVDAVSDGCALPPVVTAAATLARQTLALDGLDAEQSAALELSERDVQMGELWAIALNIGFTRRLLYEDADSAVAYVDDITHMRAPDDLEVSRMQKLSLLRVRASGLNAFGKLNAAEDLCKALPADLVVAPYARTLLIGGRLDECLAECESALAGTAWASRERAEIRAIQSAALRRRGEEKAAYTTASKALDWCARLGTALPIAVLPKADRNALLVATKDNIRWPRVAAAIGIEPDELCRRFAELEQGYPDHGLLVCLTDREDEILRRLAAGWSPDAIAKQLSVTTAAVRKNTNNLYKKLDAHSRSEALTTARRLGVLRSR